MKMKRYFVCIFIAVACTLVLLAQNLTPQQKYIEKWAPVAVAEMYRSGVPASITLAQGLLESRYGLSALASEGNNHFGIKCHKDWKGKTMAYDDDAKGECFRVYDSADESFQDHSDFLRYRDRYKFLFEFDTKDYKAWAYGLKKAGYATDPAYPAKLIKYIDDYGLDRYDSMTLADFDVQADEPAAGDEVVDEPAAKDEHVVKEGKVIKSEAKAKKQKKAAKAKKARKDRRDRNAKPEQGDRETASAKEAPSIPESPLSLEEPKRIDKSTLEEFKFSLSRETYSKNGVPFVLSVEGESYESIARSNNLFLNEILRFNDLTAPKELLPGTVVYLQGKKNQCEKGLEKYIVGDDSETLWGICQRFGVKKSAVEKMNGFQAGYQPREGDTIVLRGKKKKS
jgi:Muramidase (flagellum-specific)